VEVLTLCGLVTYCLLFFIHLDHRRVEIAGITPHARNAWMQKIAKNVTTEKWGSLEGRRYLIHQGKGNVLLFPSSQEQTIYRDHAVCCRGRLGGLVKYFHRKAA
jgi:hypothetical protein